MQNQRGWVTEQAAAHIAEDMLTGPNGTILSELLRHLTACGDDIDVLLQRILDRVAEARQKVEQARGKASAVHDQKELAFRTLIEQHEAAMEQAGGRAQLESLRNNLLALRRTSEGLANQISELRCQRDLVLSKLSELRDERFSIRQSVTSTINNNLSPAIRVSVEQFGEVSR